MAAGTLDCSCKISGAAAYVDCVWQLSVSKHRLQPPDSACPVCLFWGGLTPNPCNVCRDVVLQIEVFSALQNKVSYWQMV